MTNADLLLRLIEKHGKDRYPTVESSAMKIGTEYGELLEAILTGDTVKQRKEIADVALSLYATAIKLGIDLDAEIRNVVNNDTRTIKDGTLRDSKYRDSYPDDRY